MKTKKIIIIGGGGHAKVLIDAIMSTNSYKIEGILDKRLDTREKILGIPVLGGDEIIDRLKRLYVAIGIAGVKASNKRKIIFGKLRKKGFVFPTIIHSRGYFSEFCILKSGAQIMAGAIVNAGAIIGENTIINTGAIVEHDCKVSPHCHISLNAVLGGNVTVGECSHIGMGAKILQGIKIGKFVTVGAGAVVTKDVKDGKTVIGIPANEKDE
ncbi:MAG: hypothetical protein AMJ78_06355 [Omnitrophica WOR_2 bacterium SM23_29]|nr:MAG: hypothetical protein AMJ78_06355 [Omnitrophica WOR_2 bacterium SM23_29]